MRSIKLQKSTLIKLIIGVIILIFILTTVLPYYSKTYFYPPPPDPPSYTYTESSVGYIELLYGGWIGLILIAVSVLLLNPERKRKAILIGISGCALIGFNLILRTAFYTSTTYQIVTNQSGLYFGFTFWIALCTVNGYIVVEEKDLKLLRKIKSKKFIPTIKQKLEPRAKPIAKITAVKEKEEVLVGTDWERKEFISQQTINYIKRAQLQSKELPFIEIISKTGIKREALDAIVDDMIDSKEIDARVRDFVIIFKEIPKAVKEKLLEKIQKELQQKMSEVDDLVEQNRFDKAIADLYDIRDTAESVNLIEFVFNAKEKLDQCKALEIEKREELEKQKIKEELQKLLLKISDLIDENEFKSAHKELYKVKTTAKEYNLIELITQAEKLENRSKELEEERRKEKELLKIEKKVKKRINSIEKLIEKNKLFDALEDLLEIKELTQENDLVELLKIIEEKIDFCKDFHLNTIKKIKDTIFDYGSKLTRLELMDISEKTDIQDEKLIEKVILDMINNRELNAEYFSSSKSIVFYKEDKETVKGKRAKELKQLKVFLSYSTLDAEYFKISDIVKRLEKYPEIKKASYWQADSKQNIVEFMEDTLKNTDVFVLFCSPNSVKSGAVKDEWQAAFQMRKKGMLKIIPIFEDEDHIPVLLWQMLNVKFTIDDFDGFIENLYKELLR